MSTQTSVDDEAEGDDGGEDRPTTPDVDSLTTIVGANLLNKSIEIAESVSHESVMRFGHHGLKCRLVDPGNVYMADIHLEDTAFEAVGDGMFPAGLNHEALTGYLGKADGDDLVELSFDAETRYLTIAFGPYERDFALIDPSSIRREPDLPELEYPNRFEIDARTLKEVIDISQLVSDHVRIEGDIDDECIRVVADGDTDTNTATLDDELEFADVTDTCDTLVSLDWFAEAVNPIPKTATVDVAFGDEKPVVLTWEYADGDGHVEQMIAPRIVSR